MIKFLKLLGLGFILFPNPNFVQFQPLCHSRNRATKRPKKYPKFLSAIDNIGAIIITTMTMYGFDRNLYNLFFIRIFYFQGPSAVTFVVFPSLLILYKPPAQPNHIFPFLSFKKLIVEAGTS